MYTKGRAPLLMWFAVKKCKFRIPKKTVRASHLHKKSLLWAQVPINSRNIHIIIPLLHQYTTSQSNHMQHWSHVTIHVFISMHVVSGPSSMDSTSLLSPVSCLVSAWRNNLGPETAIATAPVGAVRRMDSTAMVKICSVVQMSKYMSRCTWWCPVRSPLISFLRRYLLLVL